LITFRVTPEEKELVERRTAQSGIKNLRAYLLKQAIDDEVIHIELDSVKEMARLLSNAANNLNQAIHCVLSCLVTCRSTSYGI
jgi:hypothetical protein